MKCEKGDFVLHTYPNGARGVRKIISVDNENRKYWVRVITDEEYNGILFEEGKELPIHFVGMKYPKYKKLTRQQVMAEVL